MSSYEQLEKLMQDRAEKRNKLNELSYEFMMNTHETIQGLTRLCMVQDEQIRRLESDVKELQNQIKELIK